MGSILKTKTAVKTTTMLSLWMLAAAYLSAASTFAAPSVRHTFSRQALQAIQNTPLAVDSNTIALWNFDSDSGANVIDQATTPKNGTATATTLEAMPGLDSAFALARAFTSSSSQISFGAIAGKLEFADKTQLTYEAVLRVDASNPDLSILFDNGEFSVRLIDGHLAAYVNGVSGLKGIKAKSALTKETPHRISVVYRAGNLGLVSDGEVLGSVFTPVTTIQKTHANNEVVVMGKNFLGHLDDVRLSNVARLDVDAPRIQLISPDLTQAQTNPKPNFQINLSDIGSGIDANSVKVLLNGIEQTGLTVTQASISGQLSSSLVGGENQLLIEVKDQAGHLTQLSQVILADLPNGTRVPVYVGLSSFVTCAIVEPNGELYCWGENTWGQLLDGTTVNSPLPKLIPGINNAISVDTGRGYICVLLQDKTVRCWGQNGNGTVGDGTFFPIVLNPTIVTVPGGVNQLSTGEHHSCVVSGLGQVWCWGGGFFGELGNGSLTKVALPSWVEGLDNTSFVDAGAEFTCALKQDGSVWCWGDNTYGQLGNGSTDQRHVQPVQVQGINNAIELSVGDDHACVRTSDGKIKCWGRNFAGQLGDSTQVNRNTPVTHPTLNNTQHVYVGAEHTCAVNSAGEVQCWGCNSFSQFGNGTSGCPVFNPTQASNIASVEMLAVGSRTSCVIQKDQKIKCWGINDKGQVGNGSNGVQRTPVEIQLKSDASPDSPLGFSLVRSGESHQCGVRSDGKIFCWGLGDSGQLGVGSTTKINPRPLEVQGQFTDFALGNRHSCALATDQTVWCWGSNSNGQRGTGSGQPNRPIQVPQLSSVNQVSANAQFSCALLSDQSIRCWGSGVFGELGNGVASDSATPVVVSGVSNATSVTSGSNSRHSCALLQDQTVKCWGLNNHGQLGIDPALTPGGSQPYSLVPIQVSNLTGVSAMSTNGESTCVILSTSGEVYCFGANESGQLGTGDTLDRYGPSMKVLGIKNAVQLSMGRFHACALLVSGQARCWGSNEFGQLGIGKSIQKSTIPILVSDQFSDLRSGFFYTCGVDSSNQQWCWGSNASGQFGTGDTSDENFFPTAVGY